MALTGKAHLLADTGLAVLSQVDAVFVALPLSTLLLVVTGLATSSDLDPKHVAKCFAGVR